MKVKDLVKEVNDEFEDIRMIFKIMIYCGYTDERWNAFEKRTLELIKLKNKEVAL